MIALEGFPSPDGPIDLHARRGDVILLRGPNGSGKTSLLRALAGLDAPLAPARTRVEDADPRALPAPRLARAAALCPQDARDALVGLTVAGEMRLRGLDGAHPLAGRESATLSSGEARRLVLRLARDAAAPLLLLDEPVEGLDAEGRASLRALVQAGAARGVVVAADHAGLLEDLATRIVRLGGTMTEPLPPMPRVADASPVLRADAATARGVQLPALALPPGLHVVRGPNGAGKSTLLLRLAGLLAPVGVRVDGEPPAPGRNVRLALPHARDAFTRERVADELAACEPWARDALVPAPLLARHPHALSGGEAQRVGLAKCIGVGARAYLLDEPEAHLDAEARAALARVLARRIEEGACVLVATHDEAFQALAHGSITLEARA